MVSKYLTVDEIDHAIQSLSTEFAETCSQLELPHQSVEGRTIAALKLGINTAPAQLLFTGGIHAREWVPPDALIYLAADILEAHKAGLGLRYGATFFEPEAIEDIITAGLVILPCANPDGRLFSQSRYPIWRGNRNVIIQNGRSSYGVDLNRNFDFLWDFRRYFDPSADPAPASDDPFLDSQTYHGSAAASEPETRNIVALYDRFPIRLLVDVHSARPCLLRSWGNDENQSNDPAMNFLNSAFDGRRGLLQDQTYKEYIPEADQSTTQSILIAARDAIKGVHNRDYPEFPGWKLYPTSGAGDDYAYSRHFQSSPAPKVLAFTMECGEDFQPDFPEAEEVMKEVAAGLLSISSSILRISA